MAASIGCSEILGDPNRIVAIEVVGTTQRSVTVGESITLEARALNARGEVVPDAPVVWEILDTGEVGITLDPETGVVTATAAGTWHVRARVDELLSGPIAVTVTSPPTPARIAASRRTLRRQV